MHFGLTMKHLHSHCSLFLQGQNSVHQREAGLCQQGNGSRQDRNWGQLYDFYPYPGIMPKLKCRLEKKTEKLLPTPGRSGG